MNKTFFFLLVTLVQSKSNGIVLFGPNNSDKFEDNFEDYQLGDWENSDSYPGNVLIKNYNENSQPYRKRSVNDVLTRRSSLDKNFMRFGRSSSGLKSPHCRISRSEKTGNKLNFFRFGREIKDNFIRFGRGNHDNFIRFGRGGKDNFIRFGKADKNFMRFGRDKYENENNEEDIDNQDYINTSENSFEIPDKSFDNFEKFSKSHAFDNLIFKKSGNQKERKNGTNFLRFGKNYGRNSYEMFEGEESNTESSTEGNPLVRIKRQNAENFKFTKDELQKEKKILDNLVQLKTEPENSRKFDKRLAGFFEDIPENFPRQNFFVLKSNSWQTLENLRNPRLPIPFFPSRYLQNSLNTPYLNVLTSNTESKRNQGGSNFIRFG